MKTHRGFLLLPLLVAAGAVAQPADKPRVELPEPARAQPSGAIFTIATVDYQLADKNADRFPNAVEELIRYFNQKTDQRTRIRSVKMELGNPGLAQASMLYMTGNSATFQIGEAEKENLGKYLKGGGFLFADDIRQSDATNGLDGKEAGVAGTPFDRQFKALMKDSLVLGSEGEKWRKIPKDHPLYSSFFDFPDGPPMGGAGGGNVRDLEMLERRGRVVVVFSDLNLSWYWGDPLAEARERGLQLGANLIAFVLTQGVALGR
jgi:hypothetical protein